MCLAIILTLETSLEADLRFMPKIQVTENVFELYFHMCSKFSFKHELLTQQWTLIQKTHFQAFPDAPKSSTET